MTAGSPSATVRMRRERRAPLWVGVYSGIRSTILTLAAIVGAVCIVVFVIALATGIRPVVVISGSMEPGVPVGSVVFTQPGPATEVEPGDIVTVERPRELGLVTHRVVSVEPAAGDAVSLVLRGDANESDDPQPYVVDQVGRYLFHVIGVGYLSLFLQGAKGIYAAVGIAVAFIGLFLLDPSRLRAQPAAPATDDRGDVDADG